MRLKRFNESKDSVIDINYVKECLIDIIDDDFRVVIDNDIDDYGNIETNKLNVDIYTFSHNKYVSEQKKISELVNTFDRINEMVKDLEVSINKIKIKYSEISSSIWMEPSKITIRLYL